MPGSQFDLLRRLGGASRWLAVVATTRSDGSIHASLVNAGLLDNPVTGEPAVGLVVRGDARKLALFRHSGRGVAVFQHGWEWVSVEGPSRSRDPTTRSAAWPRRPFLRCGERCSRLPVEATRTGTNTTG